MKRQKEPTYKISYNKLWKRMIDLDIKNGQLRDGIGVSKSTMAKMGRNEEVSLSVLLSVCEYIETEYGIDCDFGDIIEAKSPEKLKIISHKTEVRNDLPENE